jgi:D-sedoheptulose 7-phosphate isomerase
MAGARNVTAVCDLTSRIEDQLGARNRLCAAFFSREADRLADACRAMSDRFLQGGRLLAFGRGPYATDAQHVSVEFVHPVIVGKRALPAVDLSIGFPGWIDAILSPYDMVMGFGPPGGDADVLDALETARRRGAMTFALPGPSGDYRTGATAEDPFVHQEILEMLYHTLWETVHVFFERRELGHDVGAAGFLYPFLGCDRQPPDDAMHEVARSIRMKAADDGALRDRVADEQADAIGAAAIAIRKRLERNGRLLLFGNGGSATDANDWALDCACPPHGYRAVPALSLAMEPAIATAVANDVGTDLVFLRQMAAHARPDDVAIAFSTSGGSRNVVAALEEARKRGLLTIALAGYDGGEIGRRGLADILLVVGSDYIPRIQEIHASMYHIIRDLLEGLDRG